MENTLLLNIKFEYEFTELIGEQHEKKEVAALKAHIETELLKMFQYEEQVNKIKFQLLLIE